MAVSAYKDGRLKKNPLLGTALAADIDRGRERESFGQLYTEAKGMAGQGRAGMESVLAKRYAQFAEPGQKALGELRGKHEALQSEAAGLRDPELEAERQRKLTSTSTILNTLQDPAIWKSKHIPGDIRESFTKETGQKVQKKARGAQQLKKYYAQRQTELEAERTSYEQQIADKAEELQLLGKPIEAEMERRQGSLQQQIADYNLFLGMG